MSLMTTYKKDIQYIKEEIQQRVYMAQFLRFHKMLTFYPSHPKQLYFAILGILYL